jgi:hypothetical protein
MRLCLVVLIYALALSSAQTVNGGGRSASEREGDVARMWLHQDEDGMHSRCVRRSCGINCCCRRSRCEGDCAGFWNDFSADCGREGIEGDEGRRTTVLVDDGTTRFFLGSRDIDRDLVHFFIWKIHYLLVCRIAKRDNLVQIVRIKDWKETSA